MPAPTIAALPTAPSRNQAPDVFTTTADAFVGALSPFQSQLNALVAYLNSTAIVLGQFQDGTPAAPSIRFESDPDTGFYRVGANQIAAATNGVTRFTLTDTAATFTGNVSGADLLSGTYTPTLTNVTNVTSSIAYQCQYMRVGNVVTVSGAIDIDANATNVETEVGISLPIASNFVGAQNLSGSGGFDGTTTWGEMALLRADLASDRARLMCRPTSSSPRTCNFHFTYRIM